VQSRVYDKKELDTVANEKLKGGIDAGLAPLAIYSSGKGCPLLVTSVDRDFALKMIARLRKGNNPFGSDALGRGAASFACQWFVVYPSTPYVGALAGSRGITIPALLLKNGEIFQAKKELLYSLFEKEGGMLGERKDGSPYACVGQSYPGSEACEKEMWIKIDGMGKEKGVLKVTLTDCSFSIGHDGTFYVVGPTQINMLYIPAGEATIRRALSGWAENDEKRVSTYLEKL
jgi:hypothetical protein